MIAEYELNSASEQQHCDHFVARKNPPSDEDPEDYRWPVWRAADDDFTLIVHDAAPEAALTPVEEKANEVVWASEAEQEYIKRVRAEIVKEQAFYLEDPPEHRFENVLNGRAEELLEHRGYEDVEQIKDAFWYPDRAEAVIEYKSSRGKGMSTVIWRGDSLSFDERNLLLEGTSIGSSDEDAPGREDVAEVIEQNSTLYSREADLTACWWDDVDNLKTIALWVDEDITQQSVWQSEQNYVEKMRRVCWEIAHVWPYVPNDKRPDEAEAVMRTVERGDPLNPNFRVDEE